jgi:hypothetical protein
VSPTGFWSQYYYTQTQVNSLTYHSRTKLDLAGSCLSHGLSSFPQAGRTRTSLSVLDVFAAMSSARSPSRPFLQPIDWYHFHGRMQ